MLHLSASQQKKKKETKFRFFFKPEISEKNQNIAQTHQTTHKWHYPQIRPH